jgi:co-chaperonin GroES (HSP10)
MAISIINGFVAIKDQAPFGGLMKGEVILISAGVTAVSVGNNVFYAQEDTQAATYNGAEYVIIPATKIMGKL